MTWVQWLRHLHFCPYSCEFPSLQRKAKLISQGSASPRPPAMPGGMWIQVPAGSSCCWQSESFYLSLVGRDLPLSFQCGGVSSQRMFLSFFPSWHYPVPFSQAQWRVCLVAKVVSPPAYPAWSQIWQNTLALPPVLAGLWEGWKLLLASTSTSTFPWSQEVTRKTSVALMSCAWLAQSSSTVHKAI